MPGDGSSRKKKRVVLFIKASEISCLLQNIPVGLAEADPEIAGSCGGRPGYGNHSFGQRLPEKHRVADRGKRLGIHHETPDLIGKHPRIQAPSGDGMYQLSLRALRILILAAPHINSRIVDQKLAKELKSLAVRFGDGNDSLCLRKNAKKNGKSVNDLPGILQNPAVVTGQIGLALHAVGNDRIHRRPAGIQKLIFRRKSRAAKAYNARIPDRRQDLLPRHARRIDVVPPCKRHIQPVVLNNNGRNRLPRNVRHILHRNHPPRH